MLRLTFCVWFLFSCFATIAQKPFEGKITYKLTTDNKDRSGTIEVFYGNQLIKSVLKTVGMESKKMDMMIVDLSRNLVYEILDSSKTYTADTISTNPINSLFSRYQLSGKTSKILDQPCSEFFYIDTVKNDFVGNLDFHFWYADSLYFPVSDKYLKSDDIVMFTNGKNVGMGMTMKMDVFKKETFIQVDPIRIEPIPMPGSVFNLPEGYTLIPKRNIQFVTEPGGLRQEKNITIELSEVRAEEPPPPPPPPPPAPPKKKKNHEP